MLNSHNLFLRFIFPVLYQGGNQGSTEPAQSPHWCEDKALGIVFYYRDSGLRLQSPASSLSLDTCQPDKHLCECENLPGSIFVIKIVVLATRLEPSPWDIAHKAFTTRSLVGLYICLLICPLPENQEVAGWALLLPTDGCIQKSLSVVGGESESLWTEIVPRSQREFCLPPCSLDKRARPHEKAGHLTYAKAIKQHFSMVFASGSS